MVYQRSLFMRRSLARIIRVAYNLYWEEQEHLRQLAHRLEVLEEHLASLKESSTRPYRNNIKNIAKEVRGSIKLTKERIKFLRSKITFFPSKIPLG